MQNLRFWLVRKYCMLCAAQHTRSCFYACCQLTAAAALLCSTQDPNLTFGDWATRTNARINEIKQQQDSVAAVSISGPDGITATVGQVVAAFQAAGASTAWLPAAPAVGPPLSVADYNLATWDGNTTAYLSCNLDIRGPEYLGMCTDMPVTCASQTNDTAPYSCARVEDNSTVPGTIRNSTYRWEKAPVLTDAAQHRCLCCTRRMKDNIWACSALVFSAQSCAQGGCSA